MRTLARAASELTPVVVELGTALPRLASFVDSVDDQALILAPIAVQGIPVPEAFAGSVTIRSDDPLRPFELRARRIEPAGPGRARIDLRDALVSVGSGSTPTSANEPMVMALAAGTEALDGYTFPVIELGADDCVVETTVPLEPGRTFAPTELFGEGRVVRQAAATIVETVPWLAPDGSRRFRSRLRLESRPPGMDGRSYDVQSEPRRLLRILELAALTGVAGWYEAPGWGRDGLHLAGYSDAELTLKLDGTLPERLPVPARITVGFELFAISYEMQVRLLRLRGGELVVAMPLVLRRRRRRREERVAFRGPDGPVLTCRNPLSGASERYPVRDLSLGGLCLEMSERAPVWEGLALENAVVSWRRESLRLASASVRSVEHADDGAVRGHLELVGLDPRTEERLLGWIASLRHPQLERHDGGDFRTVLDLYRRAGLLSEYMMRNLEALAPSASTGWRRLHAPGADLANTFTYRSGETLAAAITSIHAWDRTWFTQHFGAVSTAGGRTSGALAMINVEHILARRDANYMAFFVNTANAPVNAFHQRFLDLTGTAETLSRSTVELWCSPGSNAPGEGAGPTRTVRGQERLLVSRAAERALGTLAARALSLTPGGLSLAKTRSNFRRAALERSRTADLAFNDEGRAVWALLQERSSAGINLTWMLNAAWLLPIHPDRDPAGHGLRAALAKVLSSDSPTPTGDRFLIVDAASAPAEGLEAAGFRRLLRAHLFVLTRSGVHRYYHYLADRYGEVGIKIALKEDVRAQRERG